MTHHIILAQSKQTAGALRTFVRCARPVYYDQDALEHQTEEIVWDGDVDGIDSYRVAAIEIERRVAGADGLIPVGRIVVLVDNVNLARLNPIASTGWDSMVALLILALPEVRWVFGVICGVDGAEAARLARDHSLEALNAARIEPLFDPTGLREWVRQQARANGSSAGAESADYIPVRSQTAVAIDDEVGYAYLHAYTAYRFGFRAYAISEEGPLDYLLGQNGRLTPPQSGSLQLAIEDQFLGFPDRSTAQRDTKWSKLSERTRLLPALDCPSVLRVFVSAGQQEGDGELQARNESFREGLKASDRLGTLVYKPRSGMFDLWKVTGLRRMLGAGRQDGQAPGFFWPPRYQEEGTQTAPSHSHSASGRLLEVAVRLLSRAEGIAQGTRSVIRAVQAAVLATDAMELLGQKAQTTFLQALVLKHELEARAECQSHGVQSHFDVKSRITEVRLEVTELARRFHSSKRKEAKWEAETAVLSGLVRVFRELNQFDEELAVQAKNRVLHRRLWFKKSWFGPFGDRLRWLNPIYGLASYMHLLLGSMPFFVLALVVWIAGLTTLFTIAGREPEKLSVHQGLEDAVSSFFSVGAPLHHDQAVTPKSAPGPPGPARRKNKVAGIEAEVRKLRKELDAPKFSKFYVGVVCVAIVAGFIHIGVFISHLYSLASRK
jgi:hypothetical protein